MADTSIQKGMAVYGATGDESSPIELAEVVEEFGVRHLHLKLLAVQWLIAATPSAVISGPPYILSYVRKEYGVHNWEAAFLNGGVLCGAILGVIIFGPLADKIGRRLCIMVQLVLLSFCSVGHVFLPPGNGDADFAVLVLLRVVTGTLFGPLGAFAPILFAEFLAMRNRGFLLIMVGNGWALGSIYTIAMCELFGGNWRMVLACPAIPALLALPLVYLSPESPRYLYVSNRAEEGRQVVDQVLSSPMLFPSATFPLTPRRHFSQAPENVVVSMEKGSASSEAEEMSALERFGKLFSQEHYRSTCLNAMMFMCVAGGTYASIVWNPTILKRLLASKRVPYEIFVCGEVAGVAGVFLSALSIDWLGRKKAIIWGFALNGIFTVLWAFLPHYWAILFLFILNQVANALTWSGLCTWCLEAFPTDIRGTAATLGSVSGRLTASVVPILVGMVMDGYEYEGIGKLEAGMVMDGYEGFGKLKPVILQPLQGMTHALYIIGIIYAVGGLVAFWIEKDTTLEKMPDI